MANNDTKYNRDLCSILIKYITTCLFVICSIIQQWRILDRNWKFFAFIWVEHKTNLYCILYLARQEAEVDVLLERDRIERFCWCLQGDVKVGMWIFFYTRRKKTVQGFRCYHEHDDELRFARDINNRSCMFTILSIS